jgi:pyruvate/2-oxoglutarate dehydrogenase complex dihydrolipoamide acyltransferase (E2) component
MKKWIFERGIMTHHQRLPSVSSWPSRIQYVRQMIGKVSPDAERTCGYVSIQGATLTTQTSTEWVLQAQLVDTSGFSSLVLSQIPSLKLSPFSIWIRYMHQKTILCLITILMSGIPYAQAGRPSTPSTPTQSPPPANVPNPTPASPSPANTPTSSDTPPSTDPNNPQATSPSGIPLGKAALGTGVALTGIAAIGVGIKYGLKKKKVAEKTNQKSVSLPEGSFYSPFATFEWPSVNNQPQPVPPSPLGAKEKAYQILDEGRFKAAVKTLSDTAKLIEPTNPDQQQANKHQAYKAELDRALGYLQKVTDREAEHTLLANSLKFLHENSIVDHGHEHFQALKALHEHYEALRPLK